MWLIEQISRKQEANCVRGPAILYHLLCKYYPWILVLETRIYIKHDSERCQPQLTLASVSPPPPFPFPPPSPKKGRRRNSLACVTLYDFPLEAIPGKRVGKEMYYKFVFADPFSAGFISNRTPPPTSLPHSPLFPPLCLFPRLRPFEAF